MNLIGFIVKQRFVVTLLLLINVSVGQASVTFNVEGVFNEPLKTTGGTVGDTIFSGSFDWDSSTSTLSGLSGVMNSSMASMKQDINLTYSLDTTVIGNTVTANVFKDNTTNVFIDGGYVAGEYKTNGLGNAYFSFSFDKNTMIGNVDSIVYGDCTPLGMMGSVCMTGLSAGINGFGGTMGAIPSSLTISAVPVPAAVWLFGSALVGMVGVNRKRTLSI